MMLIDCIQSYKEKQFAIVLADTDRDGAAIVADRLISLVQNHFSKSSGNSTAESSAVNIGIAEYPTDADSIEQLINQAVEALFESKKENHTLILKN